MPNENNINQENSSLNDRAESDKKINQQKLSKGVSSEDDEYAGETYSKNLMNKAQTQVRENEDASLQDNTYSFDENNTDNEEYHDADEGDLEDFDIDNDDDFVL